jgi:hypothetical protein
VSPARPTSFARRRRRIGAIAALAAAALGQDVASRPALKTAKVAVERGVAFLIGAANADGSYGGPKNKTMTDSFANAETHEAWRVATTGLVVHALLDAGSDEAKAVAYRACDRLAKTADDLKRGDSWDIDNVWGYVYGLQGLSRALVEPGLDPSRKDAMTAAARAYLKGLALYQSPNGGWGYYADPEAAWRPEWATSFTTAAALVAMTDARKAGLVVSPTVYDAAVRAVARCRLPDAAYTYSVMARPYRRGGLQSVEHPRGSLGRTAACSFALNVAGRDVDEKERRLAIDRFFEEHAFLDCALRKPIPHESWYANAAYFYLFGHYYAARLIETLPKSERAAAFDALIPHVVKTQEKEGGMWDFYISNHTKPYGTAFGVLALQSALRDA